MTRATDVLDHSSSKRAAPPVAKSSARGVREIIRTVLWYNPERVAGVVVIPCKLTAPIYRADLNKSLTIIYKSILGRY